VDDAAAQFDRILMELRTRVANVKDPPRWSDNRFFRRFARQAIDGRAWPCPTELKESKILR
jgi:hypothetical protein